MNNPQLYHTLSRDLDNLPIAAAATTPPERRCLSWLKTRPPVPYRHELAGSILPPPMLPEVYVGEYNEIYDKFKWLQ
jgi:hypothetical protein